SLTNVRMVFAQSAVPSWTGDQQYLVLLANKTIYRVDASAMSPVPGQVINIGNIRSGVWPVAVKASPAAGDNRIAYTLQSQKRWYDIWTVAVPATYNPAADVLTATQITSNGPIAPDGYSIAFYEHWDWSPDARAFVLSAGGTMDTIASTG